MPEKRLLRPWELDRDYGIKSEFLAALASFYGLKVRGLGESLYCRIELESKLDQHADDGRPSIAEMKKLARERKKHEATAETS